MSHEPATEAAIQRVCDRLVAREVVHCASVMVDAIIRAEPAAALGIDDDERIGWATADDWQSTFSDVAATYVDSDGDGWAVLDSNAPAAGLSTEDRDEHLAYYGEPIDLDDDGAPDDWQAACEALGIDDPQQREALEHWIVSSWFADQLREQGEIVFGLFDFDIWGRTCSGQAIGLDCVIRRIAHGMEILPGQRHAWESAE